VQERTGSLPHLHMTELRYSSLDPASLSFGRHVSSSSSSAANTTADGTDIALTPGEYELYQATRSLDYFQITDPTTLQPYSGLVAELNPVSIECGWSGVCVGGTSSAHALRNVWIYDASGSYVGGYLVGSGTATLAEGELVLSGDNARAAIATDQGLVLLTLPN